MISFKWILSLILLSRMSLVDSEPNKQVQQQQQQLEQHSQVGSLQSLNKSPFWEYMLRESIFRTISPPPLANNALYRHLLEAPLYSGPQPPTFKNDNSVALSRGNIYCLPNGRWMLCQEGCVECDPCTQQKTPVAKWILKRVKRLSPYGRPRFDHQLTVIPQLDGSYHMRTLWPRSYVYLSSEGEQLAYELGRVGHPNGADAFANPDNEHRLQDKVDESEFTSNPVLEQVDNNVRPKQRQRFGKQRARIRTTQKPGTIESSTVLIELGMEGDREQLPQLILGTDQQGLKHLVHVVAAEDQPVPENSTGASNVSDRGPRTTKQPPDYYKPAYQRMLRRIFDSLNTHKHSIENFLQSSINQTNRNPEIPEDDYATEEQGIRSRLKRTDPDGFFHRYNNGSNKSQSLIGEGRLIISNPAVQRGKSHRGINTTEALNSIRSRNEASDNGFKVDPITYTNISNSVFDRSTQVALASADRTFDSSTTISRSAKGAN